MALVLQIVHTGSRPPFGINRSNGVMADMDPPPPGGAGHPPMPSVRTSSLPSSAPAPVPHPRTVTAQAVVHQAPSASQQPQIPPQLQQQQHLQPQVIIATSGGVPQQPPPPTSSNQVSVCLFVYFPPRFWHLRFAIYGLGLLANFREVLNILQRGPSLTVGVSVKSSR